MFGKITTIIVCHQRSDFKAAYMHQIPFRLELRPRPRWGSLQHPRPLDGFKGLLLREGKGKGVEGKEGKGRGGEGKGGERREKEGRKCRVPPPTFE